MAAVVSERVYPPPLLDDDSAAPKKKEPWPDWVTPVGLKLFDFRLVVAVGSMPDVLDPGVVGFDRHCVDCGVVRGGPFQRFAHAEGCRGAVLSYGELWAARHPLRAMKTKRRALIKRLAERRRGAEAP